MLGVTMGYWMLNVKYVFTCFCSLGALRNVLFWTIQTQRKCWLLNVLPYFWALFHNYLHNFPKEMQYVIINENESMIQMMGHCVNFASNIYHKILYITSDC